ncbi:MAG: ABC transporter ATP-binding protein [Deltaproteobacteria bacterium]|nr:ABC transporter ATP-binding protein [Deltaproteobacteria bacterium]
MDASILLSVQGITKRFGGLVALKDVSFDVKKGEVVGLMGPNGAGKTTLLNVIAGEYSPDSGYIGFKGQNITRMAPHRVCHLGIARTYQIPQPFLTLTARENLLVSAVFGRQLPWAEAEVEDEELFDLVGLAEKRDILAGNLAILSLKKLEIARALARKPELLLLDEVAAGTTEAEIPRILDTLQKIRAMGITIIIIEHVMKVLVNIVDRIVVLDKGTTICTGEPDTVMCDSKVMEAYFGT